LIRRSPWRLENLFKHAMAGLKNPFEIGRNEKFLHEPAAGHGIFDFVADKSAILLLGEGVFVHPEE